MDQCEWKIQNANEYLWFVQDHCHRWYFSFLGISFLMSHHFTILAYLCFAISSFSLRSWRTDFFLLDDQWGFISSMSSICSCYQSLPQSTGHTSCAYPCRRRIASWSTEYGNCGHIRPIKDLPIVALTVISVGILSLFSNFAKGCFSYWSWVIAIFGFGSTCVCFCFFCGVMLASVFSSSDLCFVPTGRRYVMCQKQVPGTHPLIPGNHYATTHIKTAKKSKRIRKSVQYGGMILIGVLFSYGI